MVLAAPLMLLIHQRGAIHRMQRQHTQALRAQRLRLETEVSRCTRDLSELARHLHDELGALLTVAKLNTARPVKADLEPVRLAGNADLTAYRLVQECLTNIARHAEARHVHITLNTLETDAGPCARIRVCDDGHGFEPAQAGCSGHGLLGMRSRWKRQGDLAGALIARKRHPGRGAPAPVPGMPHRLRGAAMSVSSPGIPW